MRNFFSNIRFAWRGLRRNPAFGVVAILTLTLGIAANTVTFSLVNTFLLKPLPFKDPHEIVWLNSSLPKEGRDFMAVAHPDYLDWKQDSSTLVDMALCEDLRIYISADGQAPSRLTGAAVSPNLFSTLGVAPLRGRTFSDDEAVEGRDKVALISHGLWQDRFGGDPEIIGKIIRINGINRSVVGIMPPGFKFPEYSDIWIPAAVDASAASRDKGSYAVVARLHHDASVEQARAEMRQIADLLARQHPETNAGRSVTVRTLRERFMGGTDVAALVFFGVSLFVLLIATANIANLLLVRASERQREIALRSALGASRFRLAFQLLCESMLLAGLGLLPGLVLGRLGLRLLLDAAPVDLPFWADFSLDYRVALGVAALSLLAGLFFGIAPVRYAWRTQLVDSLKTRTSAANPGSRRLSRALVAAEVAIALALLAGAGMMLRGFVELNQAEPGFKSQGVVLASLVPFGPRYDTADQKRGLHRSVLEELEKLPSVERVATAWSAPLQGLSRIRFTLTDSESADGDKQPPSSAYEIVSPEFFEVLQIPVLQGRTFSSQDREDSVPVAIVNQAFAHRHWPGETAVGERIKLLEEGKPAPWLNVVGVVANVRSDAIDTRSQPTIYLPYEQRPTRSFIVFADLPRGDLASAGAAIRKSIWQIDSDLPIEGLMPLEEAVSRALWQPMLYSWLFGVFAFFALTLAGAGIYGVVAYSVSQRTKEIAVRMALGARISDVLKAVLGQTMVTVTVGLALGLLSALALGQVVAGLLPASGGTDPVLFAGVALLFMLVAALAGYIPARRAFRVDPLTELRTE